MTSDAPDLSWTRRGVMAAAAAVAAATAARAEPAAALPDGFLMGAAVAGHQVEGNNLNSDCWLLEHLQPSPFREKSGDACDHYHRFRDDIALLAGLGLNAFRFSVEWSRVEPEPGEFSNAELEHYRRVAATCREHGVTPVITFNHFTVPRWFAARGGFEDTQSPDLFAKYCERATAAVGEFAGLASTFNEPDLGRVLRAMLPPQMVQGFAPVMAAAAKAAGSGRFSTVQFADPDVIQPQMIAAHQKAYAAIKAGPGSFPVGVSLAIADEQAMGPDSVSERVRRETYGPWLEAVRGTGDYVGVQTYTRNRWDKDGIVPLPPGARLTQTGYEFYPEALEATIRYAHAVTGKPVYVTENGVASEDDRDRVEYIRTALRGVGNCLASGVPVRGYLHWSLLDNFEWVFGFGPKFGLVAVDRATQARQPKPSAVLLGALAKSRRLA